jgi:aldehyde dehydrogenase (NAD+)
MDAACPYGLGASIFTRTRGRAAELAARLRVGMVTVNDVIAPTAHPATPFGGRGASGWGVTQGAEGLLEMTVPQVVSVRGGSYRPHYDAPGSTRMTRAGTLRGLLEWGHGATFGQRWRGLWRLIRALLGKG